MHLRVVSGVILAVLCSSPSFSQTASANGSIKGVVRDPSGASVASASVKVVELNTSFTRQTATNAAGEFQAPLLPIGRYELDVSAAGFANYQQKGIDVQLGEASQVNVSLSVSTGQQTVEVNANASVLNTDNSVVESTLNSRSLVNMADPSRNTQNDALFAPGLNGMRDDEFGTTQFAFGGMLRRAFMIDGVDNTQRGGQIRLGIFSPEAIQEVQVISNAFSAEYGRTVGGIINMVTRGGTNDYHGEFLYLSRRPALIARPSLATKKPFQQWTTYAANTGGPIKKDKLFFFVSAEYEPLDAPIPITITPANALALGLPANELGSAPFGQRFQTYLGRLDFVINSHNNGFARFDYFHTPSTSNSNNGGLNERTYANNYDDQQDSSVLQLNSTITPTTVNEFRFGDVGRHFYRPPVGTAFGPSITISGVANLGTGTSARQTYDERQADFIDNLSQTWGKHVLKVGADISHIDVFQGDRLTQTFQFSSLSQYLATAAGTGTYTQLTQAFGQNVSERNTNSVNFYAQDDWRIRPNLTLNLGVRYELLLYPKLDGGAPLAGSRSIPNDNNNGAPRLGFAWMPSTRWVVRSGYGLFYDTTNLRLIGAAVRGDGVQVQTYNIPGTAVGAPLFPNLLAAPPGSSFAVRPSATVFSQDFRTLYAHQANLQVEREVAKDLGVTVGYLFYGGHRLPLTRNINLGAPIGFLADGRPVFSSKVPGPNPNFAQINEIESVGNSTYHGVFVSAVKRFSANFQFSASYTFSKSIDNTDSNSDTGAPVADSTNINRDRGLSSANQAHRFEFEGVYQSYLANPGWQKTLLSGWMIAPSVTLSSGFPVNVVTGKDDNGDGIVNDRPNFFSRNSIEGPGFKEMNLRISRSFALTRERVSLELIGEAENLMNSTNAACGISGCSGAVVNTYGAPDFLRVTTALHSRQIQVGGRIRF